MMGVELIKQGHLYRIRSRTAPNLLLELKDGVYFCVFVGFLLTKLRIQVRRHSSSGMERRQRLGGVFQPDLVCE
jgi:hypothetical protein